MSNQSEVAICNQALGWLGEDGITSFEDQTRKAQLCKDNYPVLRDAVIEARWWRFATARRTSETNVKPGDPSEDPTFPQWGDGYVHNIPLDFLQVFRCYRDITGDKPIQAEWTREGRYIVSPENFLYITGVVSVSDTGQFSYLFTQALAARLASDLAVPITKNRSLQADHWTLYNDKMSEATVRDGQQGRSERTDSTTLRGARSR